ncbi:MAG: cupin domain-containing protein [Myxococcales bacterium]|nr:cupin domain-containing protein [Myxococcales bacterium]
MSNKTEPKPHGAVAIHAPTLINKPWGYELIFANTDRYVGKILHIEPGCALSLQYHEVKDESLYVLSGAVVLHTGPADAREQRIVGSGHAFRIVPGMIHRFEAHTACDLVEVSTPELADVVRIEDRYGRANTSDP